MKRNNNSTKEIVIIKIGGSVITHKERVGVFIRRKLLSKIGSSLKEALDAHPYLQLLLIHGAGAGGHQIAKKFDLHNGILRGEKRQWKGVALTRKENQKLNTRVFEILSDSGLNIIPIHPSSIVIQSKKLISSFRTESIDHIFQNNAIPLLYGELVFDDKMGVSILSGDTSAVFLAKKYGASRIGFASDIDGIFDCDPYLHKNAKLLRSITLNELVKQRNITLSGSHSVDVTGGLLKKISDLMEIGLSESLHSISVFNGLNPKLFSDFLEGKPVGTTIENVK